jgi:hypothetical protein
MREFGLSNEQFRGFQSKKLNQETLLGTKFFKKFFFPPESSIFATALKKGILKRLFWLRSLIG